MQRDYVVDDVCLSFCGGRNCFARVVCLLVVPSFAWRLEHGNGIYSLNQCVFPVFIRMVASAVLVSPSLVVHAFSVVEPGHATTATVLAQHHAFDFDGCERKCARIAHELRLLFLGHAKVFIHLSSAICDPRTEHQRYSRSVVLACLACISCSAA